MGFTPQKSGMPKAQSEHTLLLFICKSSVIGSTVNLVGGSRITSRPLTMPMEIILIMSTVASVILRLGSWPIQIEKRNWAAPSVHLSPLPDCGLDVTSCNLVFPTMMDFTLSCKVKQPFSLVSCIWRCLLSWQPEKKKLSPLFILCGVTAVLEASACVSTAPKKSALPSVLSPTWGRCPSLL